MNNVTYHIPNISCQHCAHTIKMELAEITGVKQVDVQIDEKNVSIQFEAPASEDGIIELLSEIGFQPEK